MRARDRKKHEEIHELLRAALPEGLIDMMAHQAKMYRTLTAVWQTGSTDVGVVSRNIYEFYGKKIPLRDIKPTVTDFLQILKDDGELKWPFELVLAYDW